MNRPSYAAGPLVPFRERFGRAPRLARPRLLLVDGRPAGLIDVERPGPLDEHAVRAAVRSGRAILEETVS